MNDKCDDSAKEHGINIGALWQKQLDLERFSGESLFDPRYSKRLYSPMSTYERYRRYDDEHSRLTRSLKSSSSSAIAASYYTPQMSLPHKTFMHSNSAIMTERVILPYSVFCPFTRQFIRPNSAHYAFLLKCGFAAVPNVCSGVEVKLMRTIQLYYAYCTIHRYEPVFEHSPKASTLTTTEKNVDCEFTFQKEEFTQNERFSERKFKVVEEPLSWEEYRSEEFPEHDFLTSSSKNTESQAHREMSVFTAFTKLIQTKSAMDFETFCSSVIPQIRRYTNTWRNRKIELMWQPYFINPLIKQVIQAQTCRKETCANKPIKMYNTSHKTEKEFVITDSITESNNTNTIREAITTANNNNNNNGSGGKKLYSTANVHTNEFTRESIWSSDYIADRVAWRLCVLQLLRKWHVQGPLTLPWTTWPLLHSAMHNGLCVGDIHDSETNLTCHEINTESTTEQHDNMVERVNKESDSKERNSETVKIEQRSYETEDAVPMLNLPQYTRIAFLHIPYKDDQSMHTNRSEYNSRHSSNSTMDMLCRQILLQLTRQYYDLYTTKEKMESNENGSAAAKSALQSTKVKLYYCPLEHCVDYNGVLDLMAFRIRTEEDVVHVMRQPHSNKNNNTADIDSINKEHEWVTQSVPLLSIGVNVLQDNYCASTRRHSKMENCLAYDDSNNYDSKMYSTNESCVKHVVVFSNSHLLSKSAVVRIMNQWSENMITSKKIEMNKKWKSRKVQQDQVTRQRLKEVSNSEQESNCFSAASKTDSKPEYMSQTNEKDELSWWTRISGNQQERNDNNVLELEQKQQQSEQQQHQEQFKRHVTCFYDHPFGHVQALFLTYTFQYTKENASIMNKKYMDVDDDNNNSNTHHWVDLCAYKECEHVQSMERQRRKEYEKPELYHKNEEEEEECDYKLQFNTEPSQCVFYLQETLAGALLRMSRLYSEKMSEEQHAKFSQSLYECTRAAVEQKDEIMKRHLSCVDDTRCVESYGDNNSTDNHLYIRKMIVTVMPSGKRIEKERQVYLKSKVGRELWEEGCNALLHATRIENLFLVHNNNNNNKRRLECVSSRVPAEKIQQILLTYPFLTSIHTRHVMVNAFALRYIANHSNEHVNRKQHNNKLSGATTKNKNDDVTTLKLSMDRMIMAVKFVKSRTEAADVERIAFDNLRRSICSQSAHLHYSVHKTININKVKKHDNKSENVKGHCVRDVNNNDNDNNNSKKMSSFDCGMNCSSVQFQRYTNYIEPVVLLGQWTRSFYVRVRHGTNLIAWRTTICDTLAHECTHEPTLHDAQVVIDDVDVFHVDLLNLGREYYYSVYGIRALYHYTTTLPSTINVKSILSRLLHNLLRRQYYEWEEQRVWCIAPYQINKHVAKDWDNKANRYCYNNNNGSSTHNRLVRKCNKDKEHRSLLNYTSCYLFDSSDDSRSAWSPMLTERRLLALCAVQRPVLELTIGAHVFLYMPLITFTINNNIYSKNVKSKHTSQISPFCTVTLPAKTICTIVGFIPVDDILSQLSSQIEELSTEQKNKVSNFNKDSENNNEMNGDNEGSDGRGDLGTNWESKVTNTSETSQKTQQHEQQDQEELEIKSWEKRIEQIKQYMYHQKNVHTLPVIKVKSTVEHKCHEQSEYINESEKKHENEIGKCKESNADECFYLYCYLLLPMCSLIGGYRSLHYYSMPVLHMPVHLLMSSDAINVNKTSSLPRTNLANLLARHHPPKQRHLTKRTEKEQDQQLYSHNKCVHNNHYRRSYENNKRELVESNKLSENIIINECVCLPVNTLFHPYFTFPECKAWMCLTAAQRYAAFSKFIQLCRQEQEQIISKTEKYKSNEMQSRSDSARLNLFMFVERVMLDDDFGQVDINNSNGATNFGTGVNASISTKTLKLTSEGNYLWQYAPCEDLEEEEYNEGLKESNQTDENSKDETCSFDVTAIKNKCQGDSEGNMCDNSQSNNTITAKTTASALQETNAFDASKFMFIKKQSSSNNKTPHIVITCPLLTELSLFASSQANYNEQYHQRI